MRMTSIVKTRTLKKKTLEDGKPSPKLILWQNVVVEIGVLKIIYRVSATPTKIL